MEKSKKERTVSDNGEVVVCGTVPRLLIQPGITAPFVISMTDSPSRRDGGAYQVQVLRIRPLASGRSPASRHWFVPANRMGPAEFLAGISQSWVFLKRSEKGIQPPLLE